MPRQILLLAAIATGLALTGCAPARIGAQARITPQPSASASPSASPFASLTPAPRLSPSRPPAASRPARYAFPVSPPAAARFGHYHHDYPATDIFAPCGSTYRAPTAGRILGAQRVDVWRASVNAGATRGGLSVTLLGDDGVRYYGSHLRLVLPAVVPGARVAAGQSLGQVGNTGDARGVACHVHFGISPPCGGTSDWYNRRGLVYPWPFLESWRAGGSLSPVAAVTAFRSRVGCPTGPTAFP
ncbi:MAG: M23 family metallopeptidase [Actinomycetota bacterium]|nr:M23 family metallopeptidase [Actinomycetota bacterium]